MQPINSSILHRRVVHAKGQYGCTDHLLLTNHIWHQVHSKNHSLSVAWIDYKKAFDSVPHNWMIECLRLFHFPPTLISYLQHLLPLWRTTLFLQLPHATPVQLSTVTVKCSIFQGDTLSPLLFCLDLVICWISLMFSRYV